jgi:two-component system chemotaxis response regulator CheB
MSCNNIHYRALVIGASAGGLAAVGAILAELKSTFCIPILLPQHISPHVESHLATHFAAKTALAVKEAEDKDPIKRGSLYIAPSNYHLLVGYDGCTALSIGPPVNYSRPSIDVLFESAADYLGNELIGIILSCANSDGAAGLKNKTTGCVNSCSVFRQRRSKDYATSSNRGRQCRPYSFSERYRSFLNTICEC